MGGQELLLAVVAVYGIVACPRVIRDAHEKSTLTGATVKPHGGASYHVAPLVGPVKSHYPENGQNTSRFDHVLVNSAFRAPSYGAFAAEHAADHVN